MAPATVYLETTVLSYLTAHDARDEIIAAHQRVTRTWWEGERQQYRVVASAVVMREASAGDPEMAGQAPRPHRGLRPPSDHGTTLRCSPPSC